MQRQYQQPRATQSTTDNNNRRRSVAATEAEKDDEVWFIVWQFDIFYIYIVIQWPRISSPRAKATHSLSIYLPILIGLSLC